MKNFILLLGLMLFAGMAMGQMKIVSSGAAKVGNTENDPVNNAQLHVEGGNAGSLAWSTTTSDRNVFENNTNQTFQVITPSNRAAGFHFSDVDERAQGAVIYDHREDFMRFDVDNDEGMRLTADGILAIGTSSPTTSVGGSAVVLHADGVAVKPGGGTWSPPSDLRLKKNVNNFTDGLEQVLEIRPVTFQYNGKAGIRNTSKEYVGVIAQEMTKIAPYTVANFDYVEKQILKNSDDSEFPAEEVIGTTEYLSFDPNALTYMLVNAIQEQQVMIEELQIQIEDLKASTTATTDDLSRDINLVDAAQNTLGQNSPNPYNEGTVISYSVAENASSAKMNFYNLTGQLIKSVSLQSGAGQINVSSDELPSGTYTYSLEVDGTLISNKKMVKMR